MSKKLVTPLKVIGILWIGLILAGDGGLHPPDAAANTWGVRQTPPELVRVTGQVTLAAEDPSLVPRPMVVGDPLTPGEILHTGPKSRAALNIVGNCRLRVGEQSRLWFLAAEVAEAGNSRRVVVELAQGKIWVHNFQSPPVKGHFVVLTPSVAIEIHNAVCRIEFHKDKTTDVSVYQGQVWLSRFVAPDKLKMDKKAKADKLLNRPMPVPDRVRQWTYVVTAMQRTLVRPGGSAVRPFRFAAKADQSDWVRWNHKLDEAVTTTK